MYVFLEHLINFFKFLFNYFFVEFGLKRTQYMIVDVSRLNCGLVWSRNSSQSNASPITIRVSNAEPLNFAVDHEIGGEARFEPNVDWSTVLEFPRNCDITSRMR